MDNFCHSRIAGALLDGDNRNIWNFFDLQHIDCHPHDHLEEAGDRIAWEDK